MAKPLNFGSRISCFMLGDPLRRLVISGRALVTNEFSLTKAQVRFNSLIVTMSRIFKFLRECLVCVFKQQFLVFK